MWETSIIQTIKEMAEEIPQIAEVFMHPTGFDKLEEIDGRIVRTGTRVKNYPALVFSKEGFTQEFLDTGSNDLTLNFRLWVVISAENIDSTELFESVLPKITDAVLSKFNVGWDFGTTDNGNRIWSRMASGTQGYTDGQNGREAWAELALVVRLSVDAR
jgi:hypothetical protein